MKDGPGSFVFTDNVDEWIEERRRQNAVNFDRPLLSRGSAHYRTLDPQPIEVIQAWGMAFDAGNAVKYIARVHSGINGLDKNVEDLGKAIHYLELWRDRLQRESSEASSPVG